MLFSAVLIVVIILGYFIALLLAERMERLGFEALSNDNRLLVKELRPESENKKNIVIFWVFASMYLATYINRIGFGMPTPREVLTIIVPIAIGSLFLIRFLVKHLQERAKLASHLPKTYHQTTRMANLVRVVSTATLILFLLLLFN